MSVFIPSKVNYCNAVLAGLPKLDLDRPTAVRRQCCRSSNDWSAHIWPRYAVTEWLILVACTWTNYTQVVRSPLQLVRFSATLPVKSHSACDWSHFTTSTALRSSSSSVLLLPVTPRTCNGDRAVAGPRAWNDLPDFISDCSSWRIFNNIARLIYSVSHFEHLTTSYFMTVKRHRIRSDIQAAGSEIEKVDDFCYLWQLYII